MLSRANHGWRSLFSHFPTFPLRSALLSFPFSSNPNFRIPNRIPSKNPRRCTDEISLVPARPRYVKVDVPQNFSDSDVTGICSLLLDSRNQTDNLNHILKNYKGKLNSNLVLHVLMNYRHLGRTRTLEFFSWAGSLLGFRFDDRVIEYVADFLGRRKLFDDLKCFLMAVWSHDGRISCRTFSISIRFLGRQGRVQEALCLFQLMESQFNCKPDNLVFNNILYVLCRKGSSEDFSDMAISIFRMIESPDTYSYSNMLMGLCKFGQYEIALDLFREMGRAGLAPTRSAINILVGELCLLSTKEGAIEKVRVTDYRRPFTILVPNVGSKSCAIWAARAVFCKVLEMGILPSAFVINQLISELSRLGKMGEAMEILRTVEERNLRCLEESYSIVLGALSKHRLVEEALSIFKQMISRGLKLKLSVYNSIICMLCKTGSLDEAERVFKVMNKKRCLPDNVTYTALIHAHGAAGNWEAAYNLLVEALGLGWCPHFHTYNIVDKLLKENGQADLSIKLERKLEVQVLHNHCKTGQLEAAYEKLSLMLGKGLDPPIYVRDAFAQAFRKAGKWNTANELLRRMDNSTSNSPVPANLNPSTL